MIKESILIKTLAVLSRLGIDIEMQAKCESKSPDL